MLIIKREYAGLKHLNDSKVFIEKLDDMGEKHKTLIVFDDMIADMLSNKNLTSIVTELLSEVEN